MIEILPMADREREKELLAAVEGAGPEARVLAMTDRGEELGTVAVELRDGTLHILQMRAGEYDFSRKPQGEEAFILDTLLRSAASWGENFGAGRSSRPSRISSISSRRGALRRTTPTPFTPMSTIVRYE